jgi:cell division septal protein FtsQ
MRNNKHDKRLAEKQKRTRTAWLFLIFGGVVLIGLVLILFRGKSDANSLATIEVQGTPSLKVDQEKVDLGDRKLGSTVKVSFLLTNVGDQPLRFTEQPYVEVVEGC